MGWHDELNKCNTIFILLANAPALHGTGRQAGACTTWLIGAALAQGLRLQRAWKAHIQYANPQT
jgi:hypothetical protein